MSVYNLMKALLPCTRCGNMSEMEISLYFGCGTMIDYRLGDTYAWNPRKQPQNGGRPEGIDLEQEGYVGECPICHRDFYVKVFLHHDVLVRVEPDPEKTPLRSF